ncbi:aminopeptidase P N-terminal domain-containing protein [Acidobacteriota bacterium]
MKKNLITFFILLLFPLLVLSGQDFNNDEFAARRAAFMEQISDGVAIILGASTPTGDSHFTQTNDFYYFTGVEVQNAFLIIDGINKESHIFFTLTEDGAKGEGLPIELVHDPVKATGIDFASPLDRFSSILTRLSMQTPNFYTPFKPGEISMVNTNEKFNSLQRTMTMNIWDGRLTRELQFVKNLKDKLPHITVKDCSPFIWNMRKIKSAAEVNLIRRAAQLGAEAHKTFIKATHPGVREKELAALFTYTCMRQDAIDLAYNVIIMSGPNHAYGHYHIYDRTLEDGDFIILDAGPDIGYYNADVSTTFPANGKFSQKQKEIYELAYGIYVTCLKNYRPGTTFKDVGNKVKEHLIANGFDPEERRFRGLIRYGGYNHSIGMATHDPMGSFAGPDEMLKPGFVFACDINMPYADQEMGIRIEDTVVITEDGYENLSLGLPRSLKEIESFMKGK